MRIRILILVTFLVLAVTACGELRAQIMFQDLHSSPTVKTDIRPKGIHMAPMQRAGAMSKPSMTMPHFKQHVIRPDRIVVSPIQRDNLRPKKIEMNKVTFNPMIKTNISPRKIRMNSTIPVMLPGKKMTLPPPIQKAHWAFNPTLQGHHHPPIPFSTSIRAPLPDYNSPYHQEVTATKITHPMAW